MTVCVEETIKQMKDVETIVCLDKSRIQFSEYQKFEEDKQNLAKRTYELQSDLSKEKSKNEKLIEELEELQRENEQIKEYNADLKQSLDWANERETEWSNRIEELKTDLKYAKVIIIDLLNNSHEYSRQNAEDFIKGEKK